MNTPEAPPAPLKGIRIGECYRFFLPLVLMTELNMISKSVIHAFLARTAEPDVALAAFNTAFAFYYTFASATEVTALLCLSYLNSRQNLGAVVRFMTMILSVPVGLSLLIALTPAGDWLYGDIFGTSPAVAAAAREVTWIFCLSAPVLIGRGIAFALLMANRRTLFISGATFVRLASLTVSLLFWPEFLDGAAIGAAALVTCMVMECLFAGLFAMKHARALPRSAERPPGWKPLWSFSWPLVLSQGSELGMVFTINLFLGRLSNADVALAAFGVVHGLVSLLMSPLRNLLQTTQTLVVSSEDAQVLLRFSLQLAAVFALLALLLFNTGLQDLVLSQVMGLTPELAAYSAPAVAAGFLMAFLWAPSALCRGLLANQRRTRLLAFTAGVRLGAVVLVCGVILFDPTLNGALVGLLAWMIAYAFEVVVLGKRLVQRGASRGASG
jgi:Na+-driven multidrug efflux pump